MKNNLADGKNTVIIGLGETGYACARYYGENNLPCTVLDSRENPPNLSELKKLFPQMSIHTGSFLPAILKDAKRVVLSPGISKEEPSLKQHLCKDAEIIGDIELFARLTTTPVVAITGSNGKSTVTTLLGEMARKSGLQVGVGGNLGTPVLNLLKSNPEIYVIELSSFQLETTYSLAPVAATLLNISPDHLDRYATLEEYLIAKERIYQNCKQLVVNRDDSTVLKRVPSGIPKISFGLEAATEGSYGLLHAGNTENNTISSTYLAKGNKPIIPISDLKLFGSHNVANALAALALGDCIGLPLSAMINVLQTFKGLAHRGEWVREYKGVVWINDSKGTNVGATQAALTGLSNTVVGKWVLIAGGLAKNADFTPLKEVIKSHCRAVILIGEAAEELKTLLQNVVPVVMANSMEEAVSKASKQALPGDGVLLSPACASFDMFKNFEQRGDIFKMAVKGLTKKV